MAITGTGDSAKEHELYHKRLRDLGERYAEDSKQTKERYRENVDALEKKQLSNLAEIRENSQAAQDKFKKINEQQVDQLADRFERQIASDNKTFYDKFGKERDANAQEQKYLKNSYRDQMSDFVKVQDRDRKNLTENYDAQLKQTRNEAEKERFKQTDQTQEKVSKVANAYEEQMRQNVKSFNDRFNNERFRNFEDQRKVKMAGELRAEQINNQKNHEIDNLRRSNELQLKTWKDQQDADEKRLSAKDTDTLQGYRQRLANDLAKSQEENNFHNARKDIEYANQLARVQNESKLKQQDQKLSLEQTIGERKVASEIQQDKLTRENELTKKRLYNEAHLLNENTKRTYQDSIDEMNAEHSAGLRQAQHKSNEDFTKIKEGFNKRLNTLEEARAQDHFEMANKLQSANRENSNKALGEKNRLVEGYELKDKATQSRQKRALEETQNHYSSEQTRLHRMKEAEIAKVNQEATDKLFKQKIHYESTNNIRERENQNRLMTLEDTGRNQSKNLTMKHFSTLEEVDQLHKNQLDELTREYTQTTTKLRADADYTLKNTSYEYDYKIKTMAQNYEQKIADLELSREKEVNGLKQDSERALRSMASRHKKEIDTLMESHKKDMALMENQNKERMKLQEDNNKQEIARLKHTNDLLRQKS